MSADCSKETPGSTAKTGTWGSEKRPEESLRSTWCRLLSCRRTLIPLRGTTGKREHPLRPEVQPSSKIPRKPAVCFILVRKQAAGTKARLSLAPGCQAGHTRGHAELAG